MAQTALVNTIFDDHFYKKGETLPEMGSLVCVKVDEDGKRHYEGLSADAGKLPHYDDLPTGSDAFFYDTGVAKKYEKTTDEWINL